MSHQVRPGSRGGRDQFSWDQVKEDKQRLNYLGSSIHGVPDKFKKGPETFWYAKDTKTTFCEGKAKDLNEIELIRDKEKQMMENLLSGSSGSGNKTEREREKLMLTKLSQPPKSPTIRRIIPERSPEKRYYRQSSRIRSRSRSQNPNKRGTVDHKTDNHQRHDNDNHQRHYRDYRNYNNRNYNRDSHVYDRHGRFRHSLSP